MRLRSGSACLALAGVLGCEASSAPAVIDNVGLNEIQTAGPLNAASADSFVYFSFPNGKLVSQTEGWDIAFRQNELRVNGGVSGIRDVRGYAMGNNASLSDAQLRALTVGGTLADFDAIRDAQIPPDDQFVTDRLVEDRTAYLTLTSAAAGANTAAYWKMRLANGTYALMRVAAAGFTPQGALAAITIESRLQSGTTLGVTHQALLSLSPATVNFSLALNDTVSLGGCNWDLQVDAKSLGMTVNSACNAGTYPGLHGPPFTSVAFANDAPAYAPYLADLVGPIPSDTADPAGPLRFNLNGDGRYNPTFNTFLIASGVNVWKFQVVSFTDAAGRNGYPTVRYALIR